MTLKSAATKRIEAELPFQARNPDETNRGQIGQNEKNPTKRIEAEKTSSPPVSAMKTPC
jgi:hypothetical protein